MSISERISSTHCYPTQTNQRVLPSISLAIAIILTLGGLGATLALHNALPFSINALTDLGDIGEGLAYGTLLIGTVTLIVSSIALLKAKRADPAIFSENSGTYRQLIKATDFLNCVDTREATEENPGDLPLISFLQEIDGSFTLFYHPPKSQENREMGSFSIARDLFTVSMGGREVFQTENLVSLLSFLLKKEGLGEVWFFTKNEDWAFVELESV